VILGGMSNVMDSCVKKQVIEKYVLCQMICEGEYLLNPSICIHCSHDIGPDLRLSSTDFTTSASLRRSYISIKELKAGTFARTLCKDIPLSKIFTSPL